MSPVRQTQFACWLEEHHHGRAAMSGGHVLGQSVESRQHFFGTAARQQRFGSDRAKLGHDGCRTKAGSENVADGDPEAAARKRHTLEPVAPGPCV
jgi:hypothetical protein